MVNHARPKAPERPPIDGLPRRYVRRTSRAPVKLPRAAEDVGVQRRHYPQPPHQLPYLLGVNPDVRVPKNTLGGRAGSLFHPPFQVPEQADHTPRIGQRGGGQPFVREAHIRAIRRKANTNGTKRTGAHCRCHRIFCPDQSVSPARVRLRHRERVFQQLLRGFPVLPHELADIGPVAPSRFLQRLRGAPSPVVRASGQRRDVGGIRWHTPLVNIEPGRHARPKGDQTHSPCGG